MKKGVMVVAVATLALGGCAIPNIKDVPLDPAPTFTEPYPELPAVLTNYDKKQTALGRYGRSYYQVSADGKALFTYSQESETARWQASRITKWSHAYQRYCQINPAREYPPECIAIDADGKGYTIMELPTDKKPNPTSYHYRFSDPFTITTTIVDGKSGEVKSSGPWKIYPADAAPHPSETEALEYYAQNKFEDGVTIAARWEKRYAIHAGRLQSFRSQQDSFASLLAGAGAVTQGASKAYAEQQASQRATYVVPSPPRAERTNVANTSPQRPDATKSKPSARDVQTTSVAKPEAITSGSAPAKTASATPKKADAAGKTLKFVLVQAMEPGLKAKMNPTCVSNVITVSGPPGFGSDDWSESNRGNKKAREIIESYLDTFVQKCRQTVDGALRTGVHRTPSYEFNSSPSEEDKPQRIYEELRARGPENVVVSVR